MFLNLISSFVLLFCEPFFTLGLVHRWRILKTGILLNGVPVVNKIWKTCCALHNWLLEVDGLHHRWEEGVQSDWEGNLGLHSEKDADKYVPAIMRRMSNKECSINRSEAMRFDLSRQGPDPAQAAAYEEPAASSANYGCDDVPCAGGVRRVRDMTMRLFRNKLIEHFDILWKKKEVEWPSRTGKVQMC